MPNLAAVKTTFIYGGSPIERKKPLYGGENYARSKRHITADFGVFFNIVFLTQREREGERERGAFFFIYNSPGGSDFLRFLLSYNDLNLLRPIRGTCVYIYIYTRGERRAFVFTLKHRL